MEKTLVCYSFTLVTVSYKLYCRFADNISYQKAAEDIFPNKHFLGSYRTESKESTRPFVFKNTK